MIRTGALKLEKLLTTLLMEGDSLSNVTSQHFYIAVQRNYNTEAEKDIQGEIRCYAETMLRNLTIQGGTLLG